MSNQQFCYIVVDQNNNVIARGTSVELAKMFGITKSGIDTACRRHSAFQKDYRVLREKQKPHEEPQCDVMGYLIKHLDEYGNTVLGDLEPMEVKKYVHRLRNRGYRIKLKKRKDKTDTYWILEKR